MSIKAQVSITSQIMLISIVTVHKQIRFLAIFMHLTAVAHALHYLSLTIW